MLLSEFNGQMCVCEMKIKISTRDFVVEYFEMIYTAEMFISESLWMKRRPTVDQSRMRNSTARPENVNLSDNKQLSRVTDG